MVPESNSEPENNNGSGALRSSEEPEGEALGVDEVLDVQHAVHEDVQRLRLRRKQQPKKGKRAARRGANAQAMARVAKDHRLWHPLRKDG
eukprot:1107915-Alexandrium_andersonii.AAC.1